MGRQKDSLTTVWKPRGFVQERIASELRSLNGASLPFDEFEARVCEGLNISHDTFLKHLSNYNKAQAEAGGVIAQSTYAIRGYSADVVRGHRRTFKKRKPSGGSFEET